MPTWSEAGLFTISLAFLFIDNRSGQKKVAAGGRAGYQLIPGAKEIFSLLFADDIILVAKTPAGLQNPNKQFKESFNRSRARSKSRQHQNYGIQERRLFR